MEIVQKKFSLILYMKYFSNDNYLQKDLKELSVFLGNNLDWVQGAGGNTSVKDACIVSTLTEEQLSNFDHSETMARFKLISEMESRGMKGKFNGYGPNGRPKHYKFRTTHDYRTKNKSSQKKIRTTDSRITAPQLAEEDLVASLAEAALAYDRFLR